MSFLGSNRPVPATASEVDGRIHRVHDLATRFDVELVYELLDAHADTADLAAEFRCEPRWAAHLDYLRALQRTARETLAQMVGSQV